MSLIVSLIIPDGIVIAGDSLSTNMASVTIEGKANVQCPKCNHEHTVGPLPIGGINVPSSTFPYAQKVFPFLENYGIGVYGVSLFNGKTVGILLKQYEKTLTEPPRTVEKLADGIGKFFQSKVKELPDYGSSNESASAIGFHIVGYNDIDPQMITLQIGKKIRTKIYAESGCSRGGQSDFVDAIWKLYKENTSYQAPYPSFSLQDAIDYADFLITSTSQFQRFANQIPGVGGDVDIGLVTPFQGFRWIRQKELGRILTGEKK